MCRLVAVSETYLLSPTLKPQYYIYFWLEPFLADHQVFRLEGLDFVCIRQGQVVLVECKYNDRPSSQELERLGEIARVTGARVLLAVKPRYGG